MCAQGAMTTDVQTRAFWRPSTSADWVHVPFMRDDRIGLASK